MCVSFKLFVKYAFPCFKGMIGRFFNKSCDPVGIQIWEINCFTFCLLIYNRSNPVESYGELKGKDPFRLPQNGTISLLTWWAGIFEPVFNNF